MDKPINKGFNTTLGMVLFQRNTILVEEKYSLTICPDRDIISVEENNIN